MTIEQARAVLEIACRQVGIAHGGAQLLRAGENTLFVLPSRVVARVTRPGQAAVARKEIAVSRWLSSIGFPVVEALLIEQPVDVVDRSVTFWRELPAHVRGSPNQVGEMLARLHKLTLPDDLRLPDLDPLVRVEQRIQENTVLAEDERAWLLAHVGRLTAEWRDLPHGRPWCAVHGDAWGANFVATSDRVVMLDLERFAYGPPEWDLTAIAVDFESFSAMNEVAWISVCESYGMDVRLWEGYAAMRDIRELRKVTFAFQTAEYVPNATPQARYRLSCIKGEQGPRPWQWTGVV